MFICVCFLTPYLYQLVTIVSCRPSRFCCCLQSLSCHTHTHTHTHQTHTHKHTHTKHTHAHAACNHTLLPLLAITVTHTRCLQSLSFDTHMHTRSTHTNHTHTNRTYVHAHAHTLAHTHTGSPDLLAAREVANFLNTDHREFTFTVQVRVYVLVSWVCLRLRCLAHLLFCNRLLNYHPPLPLLLVTTQYLASAKCSFEKLIFSMPYYLNVCRVGQNCSSKRIYTVL